MKTEEDMYVCMYVYVCMYMYKYVYRNKTVLSSTQLAFFAKFPKKQDISSRGARLT